MLAKLTLALTLAAPSLALAASSWEIDPAHSQAGFTVRHMMVTNVHGSFKKLKGAVELPDDKDLSKAVVVADIDAGSVDTNEPKRDDHLRSPDFFDVARHPSITFKSKRVKPLGPSKAQLVGDLTLHGVTKEVLLDVELTPEAKNPYGQTVRGAVATTKINRKDFGLNWNKVLEAGGVLVGDEVKIQLDLELRKLK